MLTKEQIEVAVRRQIKSDEKLGDQSGGSGHLGYVSYTIDEIGDAVGKDEGWEVVYKYTLVVTTEFTVEPDNPPYRYPKSGRIIISDG